MAFPQFLPLSEFPDLIENSHNFDALLLVSANAEVPEFPAFNAFIGELKMYDQRIGNEVTLLHTELAPCGRLIHVPTGKLTQDTDDVRSIAERVAEGVALAKRAGARRPLVAFDVLASSEALFSKAVEVSYFEVCQIHWQPLEAREYFGEQLETLEAIGFYQANYQGEPHFIEAIEQGRRVARDLCGTEPERMAPKGFAEYCLDTFADTDIVIDVEADQNAIAKKYPLLAAVARASQVVERHQPRVINLTYEPEGEVTQTLMLVGKAVTYDTGGADLKISGAMAGMSRDKGGAAAVAGLMKTIALTKPKGLKVVAMIGAVRNSIGADCFVPDEIITGHSGVRVQIGNTDAEGRLVMADLLSTLRVQAINEVQPSLFTFATLTGHAARAVGPYSILVENGAARRQNIAHALAECGDHYADGFDITRSRREDYQFIQSKSKAYDIISSNNGPSVAVARGHQFPMAFLSVVSGIDKHSQFSASPLAYVHVDIAGSAVAKGEPTARPLVAFAMRYLR